MTLTELKEKVLPALFRDPSKLGEYGAGEASSEAMNEYSNLLESGAVGVLAGMISEIVGKLGDADPKRVAQKPTWLDRLLGREVERQVRYQVARKALDELLKETQGVAQRVRDTLSKLDGLLLSHVAEVERLRIYAQAGREFLDENPQAGLMMAGSFEFDRPRERFARKLANLATLLSSHEMSITQMRLTRAQAVDMLDRFSETVNVLVPVWRQHTLTLITTRNMNQAMAAEAIQAHHALMRSLSKSLEGIDK